MSKGRKNDFEEDIAKFHRDPAIIRIVSILDIASLSILELLEYDLTRKDINHALSGEVITFDNPASTSSYIHKSTYEGNNILVGGDYYFYNFLSNKVKLTQTGLYILRSIKGERQPKTSVPRELD
jgi:hypothetical protein